MNQSNSIAIIDRGIENFNILHQTAHAAGLEVILLSGQGDGLMELAEALHGREGIKELHLICHGQPGRIQLNGEWIDSDGLMAQRYAMQQIAATLADDAECLLYGCEVAQGIDGLLFVNSLHDLLGCPVAAASHKVGHGELGGTWALDIALGAVQTPMINGAGWRGLLGDAPTLLVAQSTPADDGTLADGSADIVLKFSEDVVFVTDGEVIIQLINLDTAQTVDIFRNHVVSNTSLAGDNGGVGYIDTNNASEIHLNPANNLPDGNYAITLNNNSGLVSVNGQQPVEDVLGPTSYNFMVSNATSNEAPVFADLGGTAAEFTEGGSAVVLDADVTVSDDELDALNEGAGNYDGASITITRSGDANAEDVFSLKNGNMVASTSDEPGVLYS